jgi:hypothetical protein
MNNFFHGYYFYLRSQITAVCCHISVFIPIHIFCQLGVPHADIKPETFEFLLLEKTTPPVTNNRTKTISIIPNPFFLTKSGTLKYCSLVILMMILEIFSVKNFHHHHLRIFLQSFYLFPHHFLQCVLENSTKSL